MLKKMTLLALSVCALVAVAAPAMSQAQLLYEKGPKGQHNPLNFGSEVTATSTNLVTEVTANKAKLECTLVTIHGTVTANSTTLSHITPTSTTVSGCNSPIADPSVGTITFLPGETGIAHNATFNATAAGCHFTGNIPFTYATNTDTLNVEPNPLTGGDQLHGNCGHAFMTGSFTLETSNGTAVFIT